MTFSSIRFDPISHLTKQFPTFSTLIEQNSNEILQSISKSQSTPNFSQDFISQDFTSTILKIVRDNPSPLPDLKISPLLPLESISRSGTIQEVLFMNKDLKTAIHQADSFEKLRPIVECAKSNLSFWGTRYITADGYTGSVSIDAIAKRARELIETKPDYDELERAHGTEIAEPIDYIYTSSDEDVVKANWFTRLIVRVRKIVYQILTLGSGRCGFTKTRWNWRECELVSKPSETKGYFRIFQYYTSVQYKNVFEKKPENPSEKLNGLKGVYWLAPEEPELDEHYSLNDN